MELSGRTVLLTGATGGLGRAIAQALAEKSARLRLSARSADALEAQAAALPGDGHDVVPADLAAAGAVDVFVANAGLPGAGWLDDFSSEEVSRAIRVNLEAPMLMARALYPGMVERGSGHLVFIASLSGKAASPRTSIYSATKFGIRGFALGLRADLAPKGVGVSLVSPGFIRDAGMFADSGASPMGLGTGRPEQVGAAVVKAIERDRTEVGVGPLRQRALTHLALSTPALSVRTQSGAAGQRIADGVAAGHPTDKR
jgi:short-subunit dehydrogenase